MPLCIVFGVVTLGKNTFDYFVTYATKGINATVVYIGEEFARAGKTDHVYLMGEDYLYADYPTLKYLARDVPAADLTRVDDLPPLQRDGMGITTLATFNHVDELTSIEKLYPGGAWTTVKDPLGHFIYSEYRIPPIPYWH